jgi:hypothetical protein
LDCHPNRYKALVGKLNFTSTINSSLPLPTKNKKKKKKKKNEKKEEEEEKPQNKLFSYKVKLAS